MKTNSFKTLFPGLRKTSIRIGGAILCYMLSNGAVYAQDQGANDLKLINDYINSLGQSAITFDCSNIKQFWIDNSVSSQNNSINIVLKNVGNGKFESVPLKIQLANVNKSLDCKIDIFTEDPDISFSVKDSKSRILSSSSIEKQFIQYNIISSVIQLEDAADYSFSLSFSSIKSTLIGIKKMVLTFSNSNSGRYLASPGVIKITRDDVSIPRTATMDESSFVVKGKNISINSLKYIYPSDKSLQTIVKIKNGGARPANVHIGFVVFSKEDIDLRACNYPYNELNKVLTVLSSAEGSDKIVVDTYPVWGKNCRVGLNAKDDMSDIPSTDLIDGKIVEVKEMENGQGEITLDKPLKNALPRGAKIRINRPDSGHILILSKHLEPGEEADLSATIARNNESVKYSKEALPKGVAYVRPIIIVIPDNKDDENEIAIKDYTVSY